MTIKSYLKSKNKLMKQKRYGDRGPMLSFKSNTLYPSSSLAIGPPLFPPLLAILPVENRAHACSVSEIMTMS